MAYALYSTENKIEQFLRREGTTVMWLSTLAELRGIRGASQSRLSAMQRGKGLTGETEIALRQLVLELESLRDATKPLPLRFTDAQEINTLLDARTKGRLQIAIISDIDSTKFGWTVRFGGGSFNGYNGGMPKASEDAVLLTKPVAEEVRRRLSAVGFQGVTVAETQAEQEPISDISAVWREVLILSDSQSKQ